MKKNKWMLLVMILLIAVLMVVFVACNEKNNNSGTVTPDDDDPGETPTVTTFTVSFDTDGSSIEYAPQTVPYGGTVKNPNDGDDSKNPLKPGYTFKYWGHLENGSYVQWSFATNTVTSSITLKAVYEAKTYNHTLDLNNTNANCNCTQETYTSTFGQAGSMPVPTCRNGNGEAEDQFLYWYYLDSNNNEVRFSYWVTYVQQTGSSSYSYNTTYYTRDGVMYSVPATGPQSVNDFTDPTKPKYYVQSTLQEAVVYNIDRTLTLKAKWFSQLPDTVVEGNDFSAHNVTFLSDGGTDVAPVVAKYGSTLVEPAEPQKNEYVFDGWFYGEENADGAIEYNNKHYILTESQFDFDIGPMDASFDTVKADIVLIAKWTKSITISSAADWYDLTTLINNVDENSTEQEKKEVMEILSGRIIINNTFTISEATYEMISSKIAPFSGKLEGQNNTIIITLNHYVPTKNKVALFEDFAGTVKNLKIAAIISLDTLDANDSTIFSGVTNKAFYISTFAAKTTGALFQNVTLDTASILISGYALGTYEDYTFTIGGLVAYAENTEFTATWSVSGSIYDENGTSKGITAGLLVGKAVHSTINQGYISQGPSGDGITISLTSNGTIYAGGIVGYADASSMDTIRMEYSNERYATGKVVNITANAVRDSYAGGMVGYSRYTSINSSNLVGIATVRNSINATATQNAYVGGLVGLNEGTIVNSFAREFTVLSTAAGKAYAGGLAGSCTNSSSTVNCGKIENSYAATFTDNDASLIDSAKAKATTATGKAYAGGLTAKSTGCYISKCFAYVSCSVDVEAGGDYMLGYITAVRDSSSTVTTCYTDANSGYGDTLNLYPNVAMRVKDDDGLFTYNYQNDNDHLDINKLETNGAVSTTYTQFKSGKFVYENMGWPNGTWKLFDTVEGSNVYTTTLPELRA